MTKLSKRSSRVGVHAYFALNKRRYDKEQNAIFLSKAMNQDVFWYELDEVMYFYYTGDYYLSPFKPTGIK